MSTADTALARHTADTPFHRIARRARERGVAATLRKTFADRNFGRGTSLILEYRPGWEKAGHNAIHPDWLSFDILREGDDQPPSCDWMAWRQPGFAAMPRTG